jgi:leucine efflux protein
MPNIVSFLAAATLVIIVPGPATFYVLSAAYRSLAGAVASVAGIVAGDVVLILLAGLGFAAVVSQWPMTLSVIKAVGSVYVVYLGIDLLRTRPVAGEDVPKTQAASPGGFVQGFLITVTNPKPIIFFATFFPMFIDRDAGSWGASFLLLGVWFEIVNLLYFAVITMVVIQLRGRSVFDRFMTNSLAKASGIGLIACGALIVLSETLSGWS